MGIPYEDMSAITLKVNGISHTFDIDPTTPLLYVLADELELRRIVQTIPIAVPWRAYVRAEVKVKSRRIDSSASLQIRRCE